MPALSADPVARLVGAFRKEFPKVFIRIGDLRNESLAASLLREGHCEIVVRHLPMTDGADLEVCELGVQEYWLVFPPDTPAPPANPLSLPQLPPTPPAIRPPPT